MAPIRCHYETLGVGFDADDTQLKKAYRKLALRWHPDKNLNNADEADEIFKQINAAYEVLSDPHERAWYDAHRESIIAGGTGAAGDDEASVPSFMPNLWQWFSPSCYSGYGDDKSGFYTIYANVFREIIQVERKYGPGSAYVENAPDFGWSESDNKTVERFYSYFSNFSSTLSFAWADKYNPNEVAVNRYQRRVVEKENSKARMTARKEYNDQVRNLVSFTKKRDKRLARILNERRVLLEQKEKERLQMLEEKKKLRREALEGWIKRQEEDEEMFRRREEETGERVFRLIDEEERLRNSAANEEGDRSEGGSSEDVDVATPKPEVWLCEACGKSFKSEKQLANHEKSKKHIMQLKKLKKAYKKQGKLSDPMLLPTEDIFVNTVEDHDAVTSSSGIDADESEVNRVFAHLSVSPRESSMGESNKESSTTSNSETVKNDENEDDSSESDEFEDFASKIYDMASRKPFSEGIETTDPVSSDRSSQSLDTTEAAVLKEASQTSTAAKRDPAVDPVPPRPRSKNHPSSLQCRTCSQTFQSRNQLFRHIQESCEPAFQNESAASSSGKKMKSKRVR